jgi:hypothetical protein
MDQTVRVDLALQIGQLTNELEATDTPPLVQTDTSTLGQVLNGRQIHELPLDERNFLSIALLVPGSHTAAEGSQNSTQGGALSVDGAHEQSFPLFSGKRACRFQYNSKGQCHLIHPCCGSSVFIAPPRSSFPTWSARGFSPRPASWPATWAIRNWSC